MRPMHAFARKSPTSKILSMLKESLPKPLDWKALSHYLLRLGYTKKNIHNSLMRLRRDNLVVASGRKKSMRYMLTPEGLKAIHNLEIRNEIREIEDYLLILGGGID